MLAQLMEDRGEVWALDRTHAKTAEIASLASSLGIRCIKAVKADATRSVRGSSGAMDCRVGPPTLEEGELPDPGGCSSSSKEGEIPDPGGCSPSSKEQNDDDFEGNMPCFISSSCEMDLWLQNPLYRCSSYSSLTEQLYRLCI